MKIRIFLKSLLVGIITLSVFTPLDSALASPFAYITNSNDGTVSVIDTATNTVVDTVPVGNSPIGVAVNPAGTRVYVVNGYDTVSVIDTATNTVIATVSVGGYLGDVAVNPAGTRLYVANSGNPYLTNDDTLSVIDTATNTVVATVPVGDRPGGVAVNPAGTRVYVTDSGRWNYENDDTLSVIDTATNTVVATVPVGDRPGGVAVNPAGTYVYVTDGGESYLENDNILSVIDTATNTVVATVPVGGAGGSVVVDPAGTHVYVTNANDDTVSVIETTYNTVVATMVVGYYSFGMAVNPAGTRLYVVCPQSSAWTVGTVSAIDVSVIDTGTYTVIAKIPVGHVFFVFGDFIGPEIQSPNANFTASPTSGVTPLTIQFTDQSTNDPASWSWRFGDGGTSNEQNPTHTYNNAGTYTVSLTVANAEGSDTETKSGYISVITGTIAGVVTDAFTGIGIGGATVTANPGNYSTTTTPPSPLGQTGAYILSGLPEGTYDVSVSATNYLTATETGVEVAVGETTTLNISLTPMEMVNRILLSINPPCVDVGNPVTISVSFTMSGHLYKYWVNTVSYCDPGNPNWHVIKDWTTDTTAIWTPSQTGRHTIIVWVSDDINETCHEMTGASYEVGALDCIDSVEVSLIPASGVINESVTIRAVGGGSDLQYAFWINDVSYCDTSQSPHWTLLQDWSSSDSYTYTPTSETLYTFVVWTAKDTNDPCTGMGGMTYRVAGGE